eukprot:scaffold3393_cov13-Tisochrysis_lutea.AAC.1
MQTLGSILPLQPEQALGTRAGIVVCACYDLVLNYGEQPLIALSVLRYFAFQSLHAHARSTVVFIIPGGSASSERLPLLRDTLDSQSPELGAVQDSLSTAFRELISQLPETRGPGNTGALAKGLLSLSLINLTYNREHHAAGVQKGSCQDEAIPVPDRGNSCCDSLDEGLLAAALCCHAAWKSKPGRTLS